MSDEPLHPKIIPCKYCGQNIPETTTFCWYCGRELIARPERPDYEPARKVNAKTLWVILIIMAAVVGLLMWTVYWK